jgi:hypothetical protein
LRTVRNIARNHRGYVTIRSETASVTDWGKWSGVRASVGLSFMPGTQVSFKMHSSISS